MQYRRSSRVAFRQIGDECLLVPIRTRPDDAMAVFRLNEVGAFLWQSLEQPASEEALGTRLAAEFEVDLDRARRDLSQFIALLVERQLLERVET